MSTSAATTAPPRGLEPHSPPAGRGVDDRARRPAAKPARGRDPREAADAVAAHLGAPAVGVHERHRAVGAVAPGSDRDQAVGADAAVAVAQRDDGGRVERRRPRSSSASRTRKSLPVAWSLDRCMRCSHAVRERNPSRLPGSRARAPADSRRWPIHSTRGRGGTTCAGGGRTAGCAARRRRARRRATAARPAGTRAPPGSRSPAPRSATAGRDRPRARALRRGGRRRASPRSAARCDRQRGAGRSRSRRCATSSAGGPYVSTPGPNDENGWPVSAITSSARTMRRRLFGSMRAAATGSSARSRSYALREPAVGFRRGEERGARREVLAGKREIVDDGPDVQPGAADEQRPPAARFDLGDRGARQRLRARDRPVFDGIGDVDQMVRHRGALGGRRLGRPDVHPAVHLHRVERDDLDVAGAPRDLERERRLARRGRTDEREMTAHAGDADTGIRTRRERVGRTRRTNSPRSQCGAAAVIRASTYSPRRARPSSAARRGRACCGGCGPTTPSGPSSTARRGGLPRSRRGALRAGGARSARRPR